MEEPALPARRQFGGKIVAAMVAAMAFASCVLALCLHSWPTTRSKLAPSAVAEVMQAHMLPGSHGATQFLAVASPAGHFTARVQFNGTFPGPGSATYRSMTAYWIHGEEHQDRFTSFVLERSLSSFSKFSSKVYDSITTDQETMETSIDVWKGAAGNCHKRQRVQRLEQGPGFYSISRFCPSLWHADEVFQARQMWKGGDETISVSVGEGSSTENVDCETYEWTGRFGAMHKVWKSKKNGLLVKEVQKQAGGPISSYPASAELTISYDTVLPKSIFRRKKELFAPPAVCGAKR